MTEIKFKNRKKKITRKQQLRKDRNETNQNWRVWQKSVKLRSDVETGKIRNEQSDGTFCSGMAVWSFLFAIWTVDYAVLRNKSSINRLLIDDRVVYVIYDDPVNMRCTCNKEIPRGSDTMTVSKLRKLVQKMDRRLSLGSHNLPNSTCNF